MFLAFKVVFKLNASRLIIEIKFNAITIIKVISLTSTLNNFNGYKSVLIPSAISLTLKVLLIIKLKLQTIIIYLLI